MKQVTIEAKATIAVVDLPSVITYVIKHNSNRLSIQTFNEEFRLKGDWKYIGKASELSEKDWKGIVDPYALNRIFYTVYGKFSVDNPAYFTTASESGMSLLKANGVVMENEFGDEPKLNDYVFEDHPELVGNPKEYDNEKFQSDHKEWEKGQEQVWENPHVFIKL